MLKFNMAVCLRTLLSRASAGHRVGAIRVAGLSIPTFVMNRRLLTTSNNKLASASVQDVVGVCAEERKRINQLESENTSLKKDIKCLREFLNLPLFLEDDLSIRSVPNLVVENARLKAENISLEARLKHVEKDLADLKKKHDGLEKDHGDLKKKHDKVESELGDMRTGMERRVMMSRLESYLVVEVKALGDKDPSIIEKAEWYDSTLHQLVKLDKGYRKHILSLLSEDEWKVLVRVKGAGNTIAHPRIQFASREMILSRLLDKTDTPEIEDIKARLAKLLFDRLPK